MDESGKPGFPAWKSSIAARALRRLFSAATPAPAAGTIAGARIAAFGRLVLDLAVPGRCPLCLAAHRGGFCHGCHELLPWITAGCERCRGDTRPGGVCGSCARTPPPWDTIQAPLRYADPVSGLLHGLKYRGRIQNVGALGSVLAEEAMRQEPQLPQALLPIPLHRARMRQRGYNQAALIAGEVGRLLGIPVDDSLLRRTRDTPSQTALDEQSRRKNLQNAFAVSAPGRYDAVALIDDVITSGATMGAACEVLRRQGYNRVSVWAVAKT